MTQSNTKTGWNRRRPREVNRQRRRTMFLERLEDRLMMAVDSDFTAYDVSGNVALVRDPLGQETRFERDDLGRVTRVQGPQAGDFVDRTYDANGNVVRMHDVTGYAFYGYDDYDRLVSVTRSANAQQGDADDRTITYTYDAAGNLDMLTYPDGTIVNHDYDAVNLLTRVTQGTEVTTYSYFADGQLSTAILPNGITATYTYDAAGRLEELTYRDSSSHLVSAFHYMFDADGNRTSMEVRRPNLDTPDPDDFNSGLYQYAYDVRHQLTEAHYPDGVVVSYAYDGAGNRTTMTTDPDGAGPQAAEVLHYEYTVENRLTRTTNGSGAEVTRYEYDANGNRIAETTGGVTTTYQYDYRNLLTQVTKGTTVVQYEYDGNGDRVARIENAVRAEYVNDINRPYTQVLQELDGSGQEQSRYVYGVQRIAGLLPGQTQPVYYLSDALGSTSDLTSTSGTILRSYGYESFGQERAAQPSGGHASVANRYLFAGELVDEATGLAHLRAREYDPALGVFSSKDPIGFEGGVNLYTYVGNNPPNAVDPNGTLWGLINPVELGAGIISAPFVGAWKLGRSLGDSMSQGRSLKDAQTWADASYAFAKGTLSTAVGGLAESVTPGFVTSPLAGNTASQAFETLMDRRAGIDAEFSTTEVLENTVIDVLNPAEHLGFGQVGREVKFPTNRYWKNMVRVSAQPVVNEIIKDAIPAVNGTNYQPIATTASRIDSTVTNRGGVLLDFPAQFVGNISEITGATLDSATGQVVLLGDQAAGVPALDLDDFVTAVRSVYASIEAPGVSMDQPPPETPEADQTVRYFAGVEDTHLGYVFFEADRILKSLAAGKDNLTDNPVSSGVAGYKSMAQRWAESFDPENPNQTLNVRWWFKISDMKLQRTADGKSFEFNDVGIQLVAEDADTNQPATDPDALAFAQWFTDNYDAIAAEAYPYPSLAGMDHPLLRLKQAAEAVAFAQFLRDNDVPVDFSWIDTYQLEYVDTPDTTKTVRVETPVPGGTSVFYGGINLGALAEYLPDANGHVQSTATDVRQTRPSELVQNWVLSNQATDAVAVSLAANPLDGNLVFADIDLTWATIGENPLAVTRFYNSFRPVAGAFGYGWEVVPSQLEFDRPAYQNSGNDLNGLREGSVRFVDRQSGQALTFQSSLQVVRHEDGSAEFTGLTGGLPTFTPDDLRDGSTLAISADKATYTLTRPDGGRQTFDANGRLSTRVDRHGNTLAYGYNGDRLATIGDATGVVFTFTYDGQGRITRADGPSGERVDYTYDASGNLISAIRLRGTRQFTYQYDADHRMTGSTGPDGLSRFGAASDIRNRTTSSSDVRGNSAQFQYTVNPTSGIRNTTALDVISGLTSQTTLDPLNRPTAVSDALGRTQTYQYDASSGLRNPTRIQLPDANRPEIQLSYDGQGNLLSVFDPANDPDGNGVTQQFSYSDDGHWNLTEAIDARGIVTTFAYDASNNLIEAVRAGASWTYQYDAAGQLESTTDPLNHTTHYFYDARGNVTRVRDALDAETVYTYDALNRLESVTDPCGRVVTLFYNDLDQVTRVVAPQGELLSTYDPVTHWLTKQTDFAGHETTYSYDGATGDLLSVTVGGVATRYTYDRFGQVASLEDAAGTQTKFLYDELQRPVGSYTAFDDTVAMLREADQPWTVEGGALIVAGSDAVDDGDTILLEDDGAAQFLVVNEHSFSLAGQVFDAVYVDAGGGDDLVDFRAAPASMLTMILGGAGSDILLGGGGPDLILGGADADWLEGGAGNDWLQGGEGADVLFGHVSAAAQLFCEPETADVLSGEAGNDLLFSRQHDEVQAGAGQDSLYGRQADGTFAAWAATDVPLGLSGRLLLLGHAGANSVSLKVLDETYLMITINDETRLVDRSAFDFVSGLFSEIVVLTAGGDDTIDFKDSPIPVLIVAGAGDDQAIGGDATNRIYGGPGSDDLQGGADTDQLWDGSGADLVDGAGGGNRLWGSVDTAVDVFRAASANNVYKLGVGDQTPTATPTDVIVPPGQQPPGHMPNVLPDWIGPRVTSAATTPRARQSVPTRPPGIREFYVTPDTVELGESFVAYLDATSDAQWGRLEIAADTNGNGRFDAGVDEMLTQYRGKTGPDYRGQLSTRRLGAGTFAILARLLYYDGQVTDWAKDFLTVLDDPAPPELPATIPVPPPNLQPIIPLRNGDATVPGNVLKGEGQIDFFELSWRNAIPGGGARLWTTGNADTIIGVYDEAGNRIAMDDNSGVGANGEVLLEQVQADHTYFVAVGAPREQLGAYNLNMTGPNQTITATIATPAGAYAGSASDSITATNRVDYFDVYAPVNATLVDFSASVTSGLGLWLRLEDYNHKVIGTADYSRPGQPQFRTDLPVVGGQIYYVTVYGLYRTTGDYTVNVDFYPDELGFRSTIDRPQSGQYQPLVIQADGDCSLPNQAITTPSQYLQYHLSPAQDGRYEIATRGSTDMQLALYPDAGLELLTWDDNSGVGRNAQLAVDLVRGSSYWVVARAAGSQTGPFALDVIGPDQPQAVIAPTGLMYQGSRDGFSYNNILTDHFVTTAPLGATTLDVTVTPSLGNPNAIVDAWFNIETESGVISAPVNSGGVGVQEQLLDYPVAGGQTYRITVYGWDGTMGGFDVAVDFDPNFSGSGEIPVTTSTKYDQRYPAVAMNAAGNSVFVWTGFKDPDLDDDIYFQRFDSAGQAVGVETRANPADEYVEQSSPAVGMDAGGNFVISWNSEGQGYAGRFNASGVPQGSPASLGLPAADIAVHTDGSFMVIGGANKVLYGRLFSAAGQPVTSVLELDVTPDYKYDASVAVDGQGNYVVTWSADLGNGSADIYVVRLNASGQLLPSGRNNYVPGLVTGRRFDDANANGVQDASEAGLANLTVFLDGNGNGLQDAGERSAVTNALGDYTLDNVPVGLYRVVQQGSGPSGPAPVGDNFNRTDGTDLGSNWSEVRGDFRIENNVARSVPNDYSLMVYQGFSGADQAVTVDVTRHDPSDQYAQAEILLGYADAGNSLRMRLVDYDTGDGRSEFTRVYFEYGNTGRPWPRMKGVTTDYAEVTPFQSARLLAIYDSQAATVTLGIDSNFDGTYETLLQRGGTPATGLGTRIALADYSNDLFDNFTVNRNLIVVPAPSVTPGEEFEVASDQTGWRYGPAVSANASGQFVVAWADSPDNTYVQRFSSNAQEVGPWVRTNVLAPTDGREPKVRLKDSGEFVVVWPGDGLDGSGFGVYARQYDAAGHAASLEEFRVNTTTANNQWWPAIAGNGQSRFAFAWQSYQQDGWGQGVIGRFMDLPTPTPRPLLGVTTPDVSGSPRIEFGAVLSGGNPAVRTLRVTNQGTADLTGTVTLAGTGAARFALTGNASFVLAPGEFHDYQVAAGTDVRGTFAAQLVVSSNADATPTVVPVSSAVVPAADAYEPNNTRETAASLGTVADLTLDNLSLHDGLDQDWFQFTVSQPTSLQLTVPYQYAEGDLDIVLYGPDGRPIDASSTRSNQEQVEVLAQPGQSYYLRVFSTGPAANVYRLIVSSLNVLPVLSEIEATPLAYATNDPATAVTSTLTVSDSDSANLAGATARIAVNYQPGQDLLSFDNLGSITSSWQGTTGTLTLSGTDTVANYQAALRAVKYRNTSDRPILDPRTVTFTANDGQGDSNVVSRSITLNTAGNDPPVLAGIEGPALAYTENDPPTALTSALSVTDVDNTHLLSARVQITTNYRNGQEVLSFTNTGTITGDWDAATGTLTLTGTDTLVNYQTALRAVTYHNNSENPSGATRTVMFQVSDGAADSNPLMRDIAVTTVNDAPMLAGIEDTGLVYAENDPPTAITSSLTLSDVDNTQIASAAVQITTNYQNGQDVLSFTNAGAITGSWDATMGRLALTGPDTVANYQAALRAVKYGNTNFNPNRTTRTVTFRVSDGTADSNLASRSVTVQSSGNPGELDLDFGQGGKVITDFGAIDVANDVISQPDGKFVAVGSSGNYVGLARYLPDGSLDPSFGIDGKVRTDLGGGRFGHGMAVVVQSDGKIVVVGGSGYPGSSTSQSWFVARYDTSGNLDSTFGTGGLVLTALGSTYETANDVVLQADGRIVVTGYAGYSHGDYYVATLRYNSDGTLDDGSAQDSTPGDLFGSGGKAVTKLNVSDVGYAVVLQSDGKIVVGGTTGDLFQARAFLLIRYAADGSLDPSFGSGGIVSANVGGDRQGVTSLAVQADSKIVAGGFTNRNGTNEFAVARFQSSGQFDAGFGSGGSATAGLATLIRGAEAMAIQSNGKIVVAGSTTTGGGGENFGVARFNANGSLDDGSVADSTPGDRFGAAGTAITDFAGSDDEVGGLAIDRGGDIVVAGYAITGSEIDFALARYFGDPLALGDLVWHDSDADGLQDAGEPGLAGVTVRLLDVSGSLLASTTTDENGQYSIAGLTGADQQIEFVAPGGFLFSPADPGSDDALDSDADPTTGRTAVFQLAAGEIQLNIDAGLYQYATISGLKFEDLDGDGVRDAGEPGLAGWTIELDGTDSQGNSVQLAAVSRTDDPATPTVDEAGRFAFHDLIPGTYTVSELLAVPSVGLDGSFGNAGKVLTDFSSAGDSAFAVARQPDGKIVAVGGEANNVRFAVARYNADGSLDTTFGAGGKVLTDFPGTSNDVAYGVAVQNDGKIVVVGYTGSGFPTANIGVVRYNPDGSLDTSFGSGGLVSTDFGGTHDAAHAVAIQADGKIVVGGLTSTGSPRFALVRYNIDGSLDASLGGGKVSTLFPGANSQSIRTLAIQADGRIVVAGTIDFSYFGQADFAVARYNTDGTLDSSFHQDGMLWTDFAGAHDGAWSIAVQPDSKLVVGGYSLNGSNTDFALTRYNADGSDDATFGAGGKLRTDFAGGDDAVAGLALQTDGKIVVAGTVNHDGQRDFGLALYDSSGALVSSWGTGGKLITDLGGSRDDDASGMLLQPDGKIVVVGTASNGANGDFALVRYSEDAPWLQTAPPAGTYTVKVGSGDILGDRDFGNFQTVTFSGRVFSDLNSNGQDDSGEPGLPGWSIQLDRGADGTVETTATTDTDGNFEFRDLGPGVYRLREVPQYRWTQTTAGPDDLTARSGEDVTNIRFGNAYIETLLVERLTPTASGFSLDFNLPVATADLNLCDGAGGKLGPTDLVVVDGASNLVAGSLVAGGDPRTVTWIATGGVLPLGTYRVTARSGAAAFHDLEGNFLDGNADGTAGGDFLGEFTVASSSGRVLSMSDAAVGAGQLVKIPAWASGWPIRIDHADALTSVAFDAVFNPVLLNVTDAVLAAGVPADWSVAVDLSTLGVAHITASGTTALSGTNVEIARLIAAVPNDAPYGASQVIRLENVLLNGGAIAAVGDVAVHKAVYLGDADGSGIHSSADAFLTVQAALGLASGFAAHAWTDPRIVGDADGSGVLSAADAFLIVQEGLGLSEPFVPDNPQISVTPVGGGVDPQFRIDVNVPASAGGVVSVPVKLDVEAAASNVGAIDFELFFDSSRLTIGVPGGVLAGADTGGWAVSAFLVAPGQLRVGMVSSRGRPLGVGLREIARLEFHVAASLRDAIPLAERAAYDDAVPVSERPGYVALLDIEPVDPHAVGYTWTAMDGSVAIAARNATRLELQTIAGEASFSTHRQDEFFRDLETELPSLEGVLSDLAGEIASVWRSTLAGR